MCSVLSVRTTNEIGRTLCICWCGENDRNPFHIWHLQRRSPFMLTAAATCSTWRCFCFRWAFLWFCFLIGRQYLTTLKNLCLPLIITFCFQILVYALIYIALIGVHLQVCVLLYWSDITSQTLSLLYFSHKYFSGCVTFCHNLLNLFLFLDTKVASPRPHLYAA